MKKARVVEKLGFTLIELIVVITIIALLFVAGVASYSNANMRSRDTKRKSDLEQIRSALEMWRADGGSYPNPAGCSSNCAVSTISLIASGYMPSIPTDPADSSQYLYRSISIVSGKAYGYCMYSQAELTSDAVNLYACPTPAPPPTYNYAVQNP